MMTKQIATKKDGFLQRCAAQYKDICLEYGKTEKTLKSNENECEEKEKETLKSLFYEQTKDLIINGFIHEFLNLDRIIKTGTAKGFNLLVPFTLPGMKFHVIVPDPEKAGNNTTFSVSDEFYQPSNDTSLIVNRESDICYAIGRYQDRMNQHQRNSEECSMREKQVWDRTLTEITIHEYYNLVTGKMICRSLFDLDTCYAHSEGELYSIPDLDSDNVYYEIYRESLCNIYDKRVVVSPRLSSYESHKIAQKVTIEVEGVRQVKGLLLDAEDFNYSYDITIPCNQVIKFIERLKRTLDRLPVDPNLKTDEYYG